MAWLYGGQTTLGFSIGTPQNLLPPARWGELGGVLASGQPEIGLSSLVGMALNVVGKKTEDRAEWECAGAGGPDSAVLSGETVSSRVESIAVTFEPVKR